MRKIAVVDTFFEDKHRRQLEDTAAKCGFAVDYFTDDAVPADKAADYEVVYGMPRADSLKAMKALRWFCASFAGVDNFVCDDIYPSPEVMLTNSAGAYGVTISEHIIMVTLMLLRQMPTFEEIVRRREWVRSLPMRSICGSTVTVLGTGDIGSNFARRAKGMGASHICGVRRSLKASDPAFDEVCTFGALETVLPRTDILVMALPSTKETYHILNASTLSLLPDHAIVVNVGRGTAIDETALLTALESGRLAGAALDVFAQEPLPADSPVWTAKNLLLTPHIAGNMSLGITRDRDTAMFCEDLENYTAGRPLVHLVDRRRGY